MAEDIQAIIAELDGLIKKMHPSQLLKLKRDIARSVRRENARRIRANVDPAGAAFAPRHNSPQLRGLRHLRKFEPLVIGQEFFYDGNTPRKLAWIRPDTDPNVIQGRLVGESRRLRTFSRDVIKVKGYAKEAKMFRKIHGARYLRQQVQGNLIRVGFSGSTANIASRHQYGTDVIARQLLGFSEADIAMIREKILLALSQ